jgi:hypothetical protein
LILVKTAILAANPHNTQPWLFQVTASRMTVPNGSVIAGRRSKSTKMVPISTPPAFLRLCEDWSRCYQRLQKRRVINIV